MYARLPVGVTMQLSNQTDIIVVDVPSVILAQFNLRVRNPRAPRVQCDRNASPRYSD
jgi:hypothetical protein